MNNESGRSKRNRKESILLEKLLRCTGAIREMNFFFKGHSARQTAILHRTLKCVI